MPPRIQWLVLARATSADAVLAGEVDGALHGEVGVEVAGAAVAVPALDSEGCGAGGWGGDEFGLGVDVDAAVGDHGGEAREAVEAVGVDAVAGGLGEEAGAEGGARLGQAEGEHGAVEGGVEVVEGDAEHGVGSVLSDEGWQLVADAEQEDGADDEAVGGGERGEDALDAGPVGAGGDDTGGGGGHEGVHDEQAEDEAEQAEEAAAGAAEVGGEQEEEELRGGLGAEAVDDADGEDGGAVVFEGEGAGPRGGGVAEAAGAPGEIAGCGDEQGDAAAGVGVLAGLAAEEGDEDVGGEDDEGGADEAFADGVEVGGDGEMEEDDGGAEEGDGEGVAEGVEEAEAHALTPVGLDVGDVGDGGEVVVVEAVAQPEESAGEESEFQGRGHHLDRVRTGARGGKVDGGAGCDGVKVRAWRARVAGAAGIAAGSVRWRGGRLRGPGW